MKKHNRHNLTAQQLEWMRNNYQDYTHARMAVVLGISRTYVGYLLQRMGCMKKKDRPVAQKPQRVVFTHNASRMPTRVRDTSNLIRVQVAKGTWIEVERGKDPEAEKQAYLNRIHANNSYMTKIRMMQL